MTQIKNLIFSNGERYPMLMQPNGIPDYWVTLYVTEKLRPSQTQSAIINTLGHLIHLKLWEEINNRNLIEEFIESKFLSNEDVYSIRDHCMLDSRSLRSWLKRSKSNVVRFPSASTANFTPIQSVSSNHASNRMTHIAFYLDFIVRVLLKNKLINETVSASITSMNKSLLANKPKGNKGKGLAVDPNLKSAPPEAFARILEVVKEDSSDNPFKGTDVKLRNAIIFEVMNQTGMRAGEILALQIDDIDFHKNTISVVRRHDAVEDPRKRQPVAKTRERSIPVRATLIGRLKSYIMENRATTDHAKAHPYIFVTHKRGNYFGKPISNSTFVNRIIKPAIAVSPELLEEVTRHGFRHNFNYNLSKRIDAINAAASTNPDISPVTEKMEMQIRKQLNGWSSDNTAEGYNLRHIREEADRVMLEDIEQWSQLINKDL